MRLFLLEQIELVQEQTVVERVGSAGGLVDEPILPGPHSNHRRGWLRLTDPPLIKAVTFFEGFLVSSQKPRVGKRPGTAQVEFAGGLLDQFGQGWNRVLLQDAISNVFIIN